MCGTRITDAVSAEVLMSMQDVDAGAVSQCRVLRVSGVMADSDPGGRDKGFLFSEGGDINK